MHPTRGKFCYRPIRTRLPTQSNVSLQKGKCQTCHRQNLQLCTYACAQAAEARLQTEQQQNAATLTADGALQDPPATNPAKPILSGGGGGIFFFWQLGKALVLPPLLLRTSTYSYYNMLDCNDGDCNSDTVM